MTCCIDAGEQIINKKFSPYNVSVRFLFFQEKLWLFLTYTKPHSNTEGGGKGHYRNTSDTQSRHWLKLFGEYAVIKQMWEPCQLIMYNNLWLHHSRSCYMATFKSNVYCTVIKVVIYT